MFSMMVDIAEMPGKLVLRMQDLMHVPPNELNRLQKHLLELVKAKESDSVIVNLIRVKFCSSYTHNLLLCIHQKLRHRSERVRLCHLQPDAIQVLRLTKTESFFDIFDTEEAALAQPSTQRLSTTTSATR